MEIFSILNNFLHKTPSQKEENMNSSHYLLDPHPLNPVFEWAKHRASVSGTGDDEETEDSGGTLRANYDDMRSGNSSASSLSHRLITAQVEHHYSANSLNNSLRKDSIESSKSEKKLPGT